MSICFPEIGSYNVLLSLPSWSQLLFPNGPLILCNIEGLTQVVWCSCPMSCNLNQT